MQFRFRIFLNAISVPLSKSAVCDGIWRELNRFLIIFLHCEAFGWHKEALFWCEQKLIFHFRCCRRVE